MAKRPNTFRFTTCLLALLCVIAAATLNASEEPYRESIRGVDPMDTTGLDPEITSILKSYYDNSLGGELNWDEVKSMRFEGELHLPDTSLRFVGFKRKPDYTKTVVFTPTGQIVMSYDGYDAWQLNTLDEELEPDAMPDQEAVNFIRDAAFGGHLLFPLLAGKTITEIGMKEVDGHTCHQLKVELPSGQTIIYAIDAQTMAERQQITIDAVTGQEQITTHDAFRMINGVRVPFVSRMESGGQEIHRMEMHDVQINIGILPWTFERASSAYTPTAPSQPVQAESVSSLLDWDELPEVEAPSTQEKTSFFDLEPESFESVLQGIGK